MGNLIKKTDMIAQIATAVGVIVAILVFALEVKQSREAREYDSFTTMLNTYNNLVEQRQAKWQKIKEALLKNEETAKEVHDKQNTINYLILRIQQSEPLYAIEYELVANEIQTLNFLNELSRIAQHNERAKSMLYLSVSDEITFYQKNLDKLMQVYETVKKTGRLFKPKAEYLLKMDASDWFDQTTTKY